MASYKAKKRFKGASGKMYHPGDFCPEAASWKRLRNWIQYGWIEEIKGADPKPAPMPEPEPAKEPETVAVEMEMEHQPKRRRGRPRKSED